MTPEKLLQIIEFYKKQLDLMDYKKAEFPEWETLTDHNDPELCGLTHCYTMLDKMVVFIEEKRIEKAMRWLGFIQGCFWICGTYTLEELKNHSRPDPPTA